MLMLSSKLSNMPVMSLRVGGQIAQAGQPIINPHNLKILGWYCQVNKKSKTPHVLLTESVREYSDRGIIVDDEESLTEPKDLVRHKDIIALNFQLIDKPVKTKHRKLGKVSDFSCNEGMYVQKLYVAKPLVNLFSNDSTLIIDRTQIIEVTDHYIVVKEAEVKETAPELVAEPVIS